VAKRAASRFGSKTENHRMKRRKRASGTQKLVSLPRDVHEIVEELRDSRARTIRGKGR